MKGIHQHPSVWRVPPLFSGGVMLTYQCSNACKHCLYRCAPAGEPRFMPRDRIDRTMQALAEERTLLGIHFAGGEATLHWSRLEYALDSARRHGVPVDYLETNAGWCDDFETARDGFLSLQKAGLDGVLISASLFHLEYTPLEKTNAAIAAAREVFGRGGVMVWTPDVLEIMNRNLEPDGTYPLAESCRRIGISARGTDLWRMHSYVRPGGRAAERLSSGLPHSPPTEFRHDDCAGVLGSTQHFHVDPSGNLYTGHCPGISVASIENLHPQVTAQDAPAFWCLLEGGPYLLWRELAPEFEPTAEGYVGKCHFCLEVRKHLFAQGNHGELRDGAYYGKPANTE